ncbi:hypothetical protein NPIL_372201 [Nephila pilipes]|uniref:Uncharacterized protein n=1 Tax=Nephila pilipes TaxID=299642 RepID=A0A8X6NX29_NEPPI|nr:hypothetical protein NPIL_594661 [Nephila pilipes]GFT35875.1 hypothetical protein NPIL_372201 [Nephila pilipes]
MGLFQALSNKSGIDSHENGPTVSGIGEWEKVSFSPRCCILCIHKVMGSAAFKSEIQIMTDFASKVDNGKEWRGWKKKERRSSSCFYASQPNNGTKRNSFEASGSFSNERSS